MSRPAPDASWYAAGLAVVLASGGGLVGGALGGPAGAALGAAAGLGLWLAWRERRRRGVRRRQELLRSPMPGSWQRVLDERVDHYGRLPLEWRERFETACRIFVADKRITGVGIEVDDESRLLVAASAVTVSLGWPGYAWEQLTEVLLYPDDFDRDDYGFEDPELAGEAHPWGTVILSAATLEVSFDDPSDGYHVGIHEFAHLLDLEQGDFGGLPSGFDERTARLWQDAAAREMARLAQGERSAFDPYGAEDPAEFFAVAVEAFFERPIAVRKRHREIYDMLEGLLGQDPARWERARGSGPP